VKVLVVNTNTELLPNPVVPLGACCAASAAQAAGFETAFLDLAFERDPGRALRRALETHRPDAVGLSIRNIDNTDYLFPRNYLPAIREAVVEPCLEALPEGTILGGSGFSTMPGEILAFMGAPLGVAGDGEVAFPELLRRIEAGEDPAGVPGVIRRGEAVSGPATSAELPPHLDALPGCDSPRWVDLKRYGSYGGHANLQTKRGCPLKCAYCVYNLVEGKSWRLRDPAAVVADLKRLAKAGATDAEFTDSTFNIPIKHAKAVLRAVAEASPRLRLHASGLNPLQVDEELFRLMDRAGFATAMVTAESASDRALEGLQKGYGADAVRKTLHLVKASGRDAFWYFLFGGPKESEDTVEETLRFIDREIPPHHLVYLGAGIRVQKGAPVEAVARAQGVIAPDDDLLEPSFYFSPALDRDRLVTRLREEVVAHPNYMQVEDYQQGRGPLVLARLLQLFHLRRPAWTWVPMLNRFLAKLGRKRRS